MRNLTAEDFSAAERFAEWICTKMKVPIKKLLGYNKNSNLLSGLASEPLEELAGN